MTERTDISFEEAFAKLEEVLRSLETGARTLEESMSLYEDGMLLAKQCHEYLDSAELRITEIASGNNHGNARESLN